MFESDDKNFSRMFGEENVLAVVGSVKVDVRFYGLTETGMKLEGIDRHQCLITSFKKLHVWRASNTAR